MKPNTSRFVNCYSTSFRWWDHYMGTDKSYNVHRSKQQEARLAGIKAEAEAAKVKAL